MNGPIDVRMLTLEDRHDVKAAARFLHDLGLASSPTPATPEEIAELRVQSGQQGLPEAERLTERFAIANDNTGGQRVVGAARVQTSVNMVHMQWQVNGSAAALHELGMLNLTQMAVLPKLQGQGIGSRLLDAITIYAAHEGFHTIYGLAEGDLPRLENFYRAHGFSLGGDAMNAPNELWGANAPNIKAPKRTGIYFWKHLTSSNHS